MPLGDQAQLPFRFRQGDVERGFALPRAFAEELEGEGSRLVKKLVYDTQLAISVGVDWGWRLDPGIILFFLSRLNVEKANHALRAVRPATA